MLRLDASGEAALPAPSPLGRGHDHVDVVAAARRVDGPLAPFEKSGIGAVALGHLDWGGLGPAAARLSPDEQADLSRGGIA